MANCFVMRPAGPTSAISVTAASSTAITVSPTANEQCSYAAFLNTGATTVALTITPAGAPASALPVAGTPSATIVLPPAMVMPMVVATPVGGFSVTAIGSAAGPSLVYITPILDPM